MQLLGTRIAGSDPPQERQEIFLFLVFREAAIEPISFEIVEGQEVTDAAFAIVGGPQTINAFARSFVAMTPMDARAACDTKSLVRYGASI